MADFIYESLDSETQFEIYSRVTPRMEEMEQVEKFSPMVSLIKIIDEETNDVLAEKSGPCGECNTPADQMEWQEFDKVFICPECGGNQ